MPLHVASALLPVVLLIALGFAVGRLGWLGPAWVQRLSTLAFVGLTPLLLFRTMGRVHVEQLDVGPALAYILTLGLVFIGLMLARGFDRSGAVLALAVTYSNAVMIGIPLIGMAWGEAGLVTLLTLIPVHSLVLLTIATMALEVVLARERESQSRAARTQAAGADAAAAEDADGLAARTLRVGLRALARALWHPVPLPILAGLAFAQTGWTIPPWLDEPMRWAGLAFGPLALLLVGLSLARSPIGTLLRPALGLCAVKNLAVPLLAWAIGHLLGVRGLPLAVLVTTAALPIGANVFLFSQRYGVAQDVVTAGVALSTLLSLPGVVVVLMAFGAG